MPADKSPEKKIMDVARPGRASATPTSRPVLITNRPLIAQDPMVSGDADTVEEKPTAIKVADAPLTPHVEKVIKPPKADEEAEAETADAEPAKEAIAEASDAPEAEPAPASDKETAEPEPTPAKSEPEASTTEEDISEDDSDDTQVNPEAVKVSEEDQHRAAELEEIIASGKYNVPVNSSASRRNRIITFWLIVLTLLLAAALVDALLDVGMLNLPGIPHTHFFSLP